MDAYQKLHRADQATARIPQLGPVGPAASYREGEEGRPEILPRYRWSAIEKKGAARELSVSLHVASTCHVLYIFTALDRTFPWIGQNLETLKVQYLCRSSAVLVGDLQVSGCVSSIVPQSCDNTLKAWV